MPPWPLLWSTRSLAGGLIQFIGVGDYDSSTLTEILNNANLLTDTFEVATVPGVNVNPRAVEFASRAVTNVLVLVVRVGGANESDLASAPFAIRRAGGDIGGVVLAEAKRSVSSLLS